MPSLRLLLRLKSLLDTIPLHQALMPFQRPRGFLLQLLDELLTKRTERQLVPGDEHQVRKTHFVSDEVGLARLREVVVNHGPDALDLVAVTVLSARDVLLRVELQANGQRGYGVKGLLEKRAVRTKENHMNWLQESDDFNQPSFSFRKARVLPIVRALPRHFEVLPIRLLILLRERGIAEIVLLVVGIEEILDDGARLPQRDTCVRIFQGREAAVGIDADVWLFMCLWVFCLERQIELIEDDHHFPWIWPLDTE